MNTVSNIHSRRDPFAVDYGLWPFGDDDYDIVRTVSNSTMKTNPSLWTPLLTEDARRQLWLHRSQPTLVPVTFKKCRLLTLPGVR